MNRYCLVQDNAKSWLCIPVSMKMKFESLIDKIEDTAFSEEEQYGFVSQLFDEFEEFRLKAPIPEHSFVDFGPLKSREEVLEAMIEKATSLIINGLMTDGSHHKQWYLEQVAKALLFEPPDHDKGIAP